MLSPFICYVVASKAKQPSNYEEIASAEEYRRATTCYEILRGSVILPVKAVAAAVAGLAK
jgi:hypothetical protein